MTFYTSAQADGVVTQNGVTVTTNSTNTLANWVEAPLFTSDDATSAQNLGTIMRNIRWSLSPTPMDIEIQGLSSGTKYEIQLLVNEGTANTVRIWDIAVEDELVVDNFTSQGVDGLTSWSDANSFAYSGAFTAPEDGILDIQMTGQITGAAPFGSDENPIIQAIIVNQVTPIVITITDIDTDLVNNQVSLTWDSRPGKLYNLEFVFELGQEWTELNDGITSGGAETSFTVVGLPPNTLKGFFRVIER